MKQYPNTIFDLKKLSMEHKSKQYQCGLLVSQVTSTLVNLILFKEAVFSLVLLTNHMQDDITLDRTPKSYC